MPCYVVVCWKSHCRWNRLIARKRSLAYNHSNRYKRNSVLHRKVGIEPGPVSLEQVNAFQEVLHEYQINIYRGMKTEDLIYSGPAADKQIDLMLHNNHYSVIRNLTPFLNKRVQCQNCKGHFAALGRRGHRCPDPCYVCQRPKNHCIFDHPTFC